MFQRRTAATPTEATCPKCGRSARFIKSEGGWDFFCCPLHRTVAASAKDHAHLASGAPQTDIERKPGHD